jgi:hypothetical protein
MRNDYRAVVLSAALLTGLSGFALAGETASSSGLTAAAIGTRADANAPRAEVRRVPAQAQKSAPVAVAAPAPLCNTLLCPGYALTGIGF